jgi:hypothetical protein
VTNQEHPITPPPELVQQWSSNFYGTTVAPGEAAIDIATQAARWGADQELEACCMWITREKSVLIAEELGIARRPKPPSLKEQALTALHAVATGANDIREQHQDLETIRRALETLPND